ncbi:hypothetical protein C2E21_7843 [Chlorella sorokiniana]|uniref:Uncharacterized protein n=1 Tax=Chlorella sorokiniana TaxID=3076 RepID=A0A2P6TG88_CHLSO|nr:hypothetical protein C2E21_7843 [Chlorella sorokiniana]|eukprot:PRW33115.1 hypothetical protein C2E21_7843 [Chlorella sorokiniana]
MPGAAAAGSEKEAFRRLEAKRFTASDVPGCRIASRMLLLLLLLRTTIIEHLYGLAAIGVLQCAVLESLALLACHHPRWYARHRHWLLTLGLAQLSLTIHLLTIRGGMNIFALAGGSPALLLFWLSVGNSSLYTAICSMNSHLRVAWSCWALPALGLLAVRRSDQLCTQLARAPGTSEALDQLYCMLALLHGLPMPLLAHLSLHVLPESRKCHAVNTWTTFMLGVVVPLLIQAYWEKARWRAYWQQHWRQQAAAAAEPAGGNPAAAALAAAATEEEAPSGEAWHALMSSGQRWPIELLLCSSLVWCLSILTQA